MNNEMKSEFIKELKIKAANLKEKRDKRYILEKMMELVDDPEGEFMVYENVIFFELTGLYNPWYKY